MVHTGHNDEREGCCKDTYNNETKFYGQEVDGYRKSVTNNCSDRSNYDQGDRCTDQNYQCRVQDQFYHFRCDLINQNLNIMCDPYHQDNRNNGIRIGCFCDRQAKHCDGCITGYHSYKGRA